jgi:hypothetical protein
VRDAEGQATPAGFISAVPVLPPGADIDCLATVEPVERDADDFARVALPLGYDDRELDNGLIGGTPAPKSCGIQRNVFVPPGELSGLIAHEKGRPPLGTISSPAKHRALRCDRARPVGCREVRRF